jgi:hypothetical protein
MTKIGEKIALGAPHAALLDAHRGS